MSNIIVLKEYFIEPYFVLWKDNITDRIGYLCYRHRNVDIWKWLSFWLIKEPTFMPMMIILYDRHRKMDILKWLIILGLSYEKGY